MVPSTSGSSLRDVNMLVPQVESCRSPLSLTTDFILLILQWNPAWLSEQGTIRNLLSFTYTIVHLPAKPLPLYHMQMIQHSSAPVVSNFTKTPNIDPNFLLNEELFKINEWLEITKNYPIEYIHVHRELL